MSSSQSPLKPHLSLALGLMKTGYQDEICYDRGRDENKTSFFAGPTFLLRKHNPDRSRPDLLHYWCVSPDFDFADVAAGLPDLEAIIDALHHSSHDILVTEADDARVDVWVEGGIENRAANQLLLKKITTLVILLEESLLLKLGAPCRWPRRVTPVGENGKAARYPGPQGDVVSSEYDSHVPRMAAMDPAAKDPAAKNNRDPELIDRKIAMIWSTRSLRELQRVLNPRGFAGSGFCLIVPKEPDIAHTLHNLERWGPKYMPKPSPIWFRFHHMQMTFEEALLRNWVEIIARIIELALADPGEYKKCLEAIFRIQQQDGVAWEQLMKHVLNLEHRIPYWQDQVARYGRGEVITGLSKNGLLPKRMGPFYSQPPRVWKDSGDLTDVDLR
ncbi:hypothetical protein NCS57_00204900 [Fusarium keratoplasticum]|uniref:Uncharacterized protein n=1 Tax=Fusarium keratoplasticum TaxID=1328300 RepID=A0ACC0R7M0_9HYPO|nr:hypothetical protein NCS57_00204900 [Fusarium keratoplasticum]KAI8679274.1 hypothetical protein NCS57_00204900 [Fusarium keratoplasticum]